MSLRTTFLLAALVAVGGTAWYFGPKIAPVVGLAPREVNPDGAGSPDVLEKLLTRESIRRIEVRGGGEPIVLEKGPGNVWALPGQWPTRQGEANELIDLITNLRTRFHVIASDGPEFDLAPFGLAPHQKPVTVAIETANENIRLVFGEPTDDEGGPFAKPTYVQVNGKPEVVRLGPDILPVLNRPREYYQRRQLFPQVERVKFADSRPASPFGPPESAPGPVVLPRARRIELEGPEGKLVLSGPEQPVEAAIQLDAQRLADAWQIVEPVLDRPEGDRLKSLLTAIPNLWVESFSTPRESAMVAAALTAAPVEGVAGAMAWATLAHQLQQSEWLRQVTGLEKPEYKVSVTPLTGGTVTLHIGKISRVEERPGTAAPPPRPGMPPLPPQPVREEYRYARLDGQPIIFEIRAERFGELFVPASMLRDERLARFQSRDVKAVEIKQQGEIIALTRDADDKWRLTQPVQALAENLKVNELIDKLAGLEARVPDVIDNPNLAETGLESPAQIVTLTLEEERPGSGEKKEKRTRKVTYSFGKQDDEAKKVHVQVAGPPRVNRVDESVAKLVERPALMYRGRRILDFEAAQVARIEVKRANEIFTLAQENGDWKLTAPTTAPADKLKAGSLAGDLGRLEAVEYVNDSPKPEDLAQTGLDNPELIATITFDSADRKPQIVHVGKAREGKPEYFAKLADGTSVFAIKKEIRDQLDQNSLGFRPNQPWTLTVETLSALKVERGTEGFELKRENYQWKVVQPFEAPVGAVPVTSVIEAVVNLRLAGYETHQADNLAEFGLDMPQVKLTFTVPEKNKQGADEARDRTLIIGKAVPGKPELYGQLAGDPAVFRLPDSILADVSKSALDLLDRRLLSIDSRRITKIERDGSAKMTLTRNGDGWKVQAPGDVSFAADRPTIESTLRAWESLQAEKFVAYGPSAKPEEFGLNPPADTVTITLDEMAGGTPVVHVLKLGKPADGSARFAQLDDRPGIVVLAPVVARDLARGHLDFADRGLLSVDESTIQGFRRAMNDNDVEITRTDGWKVIRPSEHQADEPFMTNLVGQLARLRAERIAAYGAADLAPFGLTEPAAIITVLIEKEGKGDPRTLKIGGPVDPTSPDGERYVQVEGSMAVGVLARGDARKLLAEPIAYRDRGLVRRLPEPEKITLQRGERKATFAKTEGTWKLTEPILAEAEHAELEEFVNALYRLRADELIAEKPSEEKLTEFGLKEPTAVWRFFADDKEALVLQIGKPDSTGQRVHGRLGASDVVFLLSPAVTARAKAEYRKRALWSGFDAAQAERLTLGGEIGETMLRKVGGSWQVEGKPEAKVRAEAVTEQLGSLANLKAERFVVDAEASLDLFGLGKPQRTIRAETSGGQAVEIHLGNFEGGSKRLYATLPGKSEVFVLSEPDSAKLIADLVQN